MRLVLPALFPLFSKIDVNGKNADPLFVYLKTQQGGFLGDDIKWNFTKFLVSRDGTVVDRYAPVTKPERTAEGEKLHDRAEAIPSKMAVCVSLKHIPGVPTAFTASFYSGLDPMLLLSSIRFVSYQRLSI